MLRYSSKLLPQLLVFVCVAVAAIFLLSDFANAQGRGRGNRGNQGNRGEQGNQGDQGNQGRGSPNQGPRNQGPPERLRLSISPNAPRIVEGSFSRWFVERGDELAGGIFVSPEVPVLGIEVTVEDPNGDFDSAQLFLITTLDRQIGRGQVGIPLMCQATGELGEFGEQYFCELQVGVSTAVPPGEYPIVVVAIDKAGNVSNRWPFFSVLRKAASDEDAERFIEVLDELDGQDNESGANVDVGSENMDDESGANVDVGGESMDNESGADVDVGSESMDDESGADVNDDSESMDDESRADVNDDSESVENESGADDENGELADIEGGENVDIVNGDKADIDEDGVADEEDNCVLVANPDQNDANGNGIGDACDDEVQQENAVDEVDVTSGA